MLLISLILFLISCLVLVVSGGFLVKLIVKIASYLRLSEFVVAFIIMAFSTSIPELFVGISSAMSGNPTLSLGNVIGSNIADLTLVIGIAALLGRGITLKNPLIKKDGLFMFLIALAPLALMIFDHTLSRIDGALLISVFIGYIWHLVKERRVVRKEGIRNNGNHIVLTIFYFTLCLGILFLSTHFVVKYATQLAIDLSLPVMVIGLVLVAIGTSLPELVFETRAVLAKKGDLAVGDAMGSVVCNSTLVLGVTAMISPITNSFFIFLTSAIFMAIVTFLFMIFIRNKKGLSITESVMLIILYILFILVEFYFKSKIF